MRPTSVPVVSVCDGSISLRETKLRAASRDPGLDTRTRKTFWRKKSGETAFDSLTRRLSTWRVSTIFLKTEDPHLIKEVAGLLLNTREESEEQRLSGGSQVATQRKVVRPVQLDESWANRRRRVLEEWE
jgi:hypothetical protein